MEKYEAMRDSGHVWLGQIPKHWRMLRMKNVFEVVSERNHPDAEVLSLYREYGVLPKSSRDDNHNVTSEDTASYKFVRVNDLVINKMKAWQGSLGISQYEGIVSPAYYVCRFINDGVSKRYYHYLLRSRTYAQEFERLSTGMRVGQWDLGIDDFLSVPALVPPLDEQQAIASYLDDQVAQIDSIIGEAQASIEEYKQWKAAVIFEGVTRGVDTNAPIKACKAQWAGAIPSTWTVRKINGLFNLIGSGTTPNTIYDEYYADEIPWLQSGDINGGQVTETSKRISSEILNATSALQVYNAPYIAIAMYGASIGNVSIVDIDACTNQACCVLSKPKEDVDLSYVFFAIQAAKTELAISSRGRTQPNISQSIIKQLLIPFPPYCEQKRISERLAEVSIQMDSVINEKKNLINDLEYYKRSLIYEVVTGKRKVV